MHCEEVQEELARESITPSLVGAVRNHIEECAACRRVHLLYFRMDHALRRNLVWDPPEGFVQNIVMRATPALQRAADAPHIQAWDVVRKAVLSLVLIAVMYFGVRLLLETSVLLAASLAANALLVSWASVALSLGVSFWVTHRALR